MKLPPVYTVYCLVIFTAFAVASYQGYAISSLFSNHDKASKTANRYHK